MAEENEQGGNLPINSDKIVQLHDNRGKFQIGHKKVGGKKKGFVSVTGRIKEYLIEHPEKLAELVEFYLTDRSMRSLLWRMIDGNPRQQIEMESEDEEITEIKHIVVHAREEIAELDRAKAELQVEEEKLEKLKAEIIELQAKK